MKRIALLVLLPLALSAQGCYGPFHLTRKLHTANAKFGDKWINEAMFLVMVIVPIYQLAALADAVVFNSVEFWTGENPVLKTRSIEKDGRQAVLHYRPDSRRLRIDVFEKGRRLETVVVEPGPDGLMTASDPAGRRFRAERSSGRVDVRGPDDRRVASFPSP